MASDMPGVIDEFYAAAFQPERWPTVLDSLADAAGGRGATLVFGTSTPESIVPSRSVEAALRDYFEMRHVDDPRESRVQPSMTAGFLTDFDFFTASEIERDPFYQEFLKPHDIGWHSAALLAAKPIPVILSIKRPHRQGPFECHEVDALDRILPDLRRAAAAAAIHAATPRMELTALAISASAPSRSTAAVARWSATTR
jgi:hypothetical protein